MSVRIWIFAVAAAAAVFAWQRHTINVLAEEAEQQARRLGEVTVVNAGLAHNLERLAAARAADNLVVAQAAEQSERMTARARGLERKLREALRDEADFDRVLSRGVTDALCLRYRSATGTDGVSGDDPADSAGHAHAGAGDSVAERGAPLARCADWGGMTVRDAVEWAGLLLDHAGLERLDKRALREWAAGAEANKQTLNQGE